MYWPELDGGAVYYVNEPFGPHIVRYFFGVPKTYDRTKPWPLVIKLPTANAFLPEPPAQPPDADEVVKIYTGWIKEELAHHPDAVVLMPLLNLDELYGPSYAGMNSVIQPMLHVAERVNIDPARVYMVGHSMAGHAVWNLALNYPTYFAAVNPLAGAASQDWQRLRLINLRNTLPVVWHDADDQVLNGQLLAHQRQAAARGEGGRGVRRDQGRRPRPDAGNRRARLREDARPHARAVPGPGVAPVQPPRADLQPARLGAGLAGDQPRPRARS